MIYCLILINSTLGKKYFNFKIIYIFFSQNKTARPKPVYLWTVVDVQKWLRRHCGDYYNMYFEKFQQVPVCSSLLFILLINNKDVIIRSDNILSFYFCLSFYKNLASYFLIPFYFIFSMI